MQSVCIVLAGSSRFFFFPFFSLKNLVDIQHIHTPEKHYHHPHYVMGLKNSSSYFSLQRETPVSQWYGFAASLLIFKGCLFGYAQGFSSSCVYIKIYFFSFKKERNLLLSFLFLSCILNYNKSQKNSGPAGRSSIVLICISNFLPFAFFHLHESKLFIFS